MSSPPVPRKLPKESGRGGTLERGGRNTSAASLLAGANESLDSAAPLKDQIYGSLIEVGQKEEKEEKKSPAGGSRRSLKSAFSMVTKKKRSLSGSIERSRSPISSRAVAISGKKESQQRGGSYTSTVDRSRSQSSGRISMPRMKETRSSSHFLDGLDLDVPSLDLDTVPCAAGSLPMSSVGFSIASRSSSVGPASAMPLQDPLMCASSPSTLKSDRKSGGSTGSSPSRHTSIPSPLSESYGSDPFSHSGHRPRRDSSSSGSVVTLPDYTEHKRRIRRAKALASKNSSPLSSPAGTVGFSEQSGGSTGEMDSSDGSNSSSKKKSDGSSSSRRGRRGRGGRRKSEETLHSWEYFYSMQINSTDQISDFISSDEQSDTPRGVEFRHAFDNVEELEYVAEFNALVTNLSDYIEDEIQASSVIPKLDMVEGICWMVAGTPYQLVDYLLGPRQDSVLVHTLLLTHPYFMPSVDLFKYLCYKFASSDSSQGDSALMEGSIVNLINRWKDNSFYNFFGQPELVKLLKLFVAFVSRNSPQWAQHLRFKQRSLIQTAAHKESPPIPQLPADMGKITFLALHPLEIARQLTLIDQSLFRSVPATELLAARWTKADKEHSTPAIHRFTKQFNKVTYWVATEILTALNHYQRIEIIQRFIQIATDLHALQNFNGMMAVHAALNMNCVQRLKVTWKAVSDKYRKKMAVIETLMDSRRNFANYRKALLSAKPPAIPFQALLLGDLAMCENMEDRHPDGAVNFYKMIEVAKHMQLILDLRSKEHNLYEVPAIKNFLEKDVLVLEDEPLYKLSQYCLSTAKARNH